MVYLKLKGAKGRFDTNRKIISKNNNIFIQTQFVGYRVSVDGFLWSEWEKYKDGLVWKFRLSGNWKRLKGGKDKDGYTKFVICQSGKRYYKRLHCLIISSFIGPAPEGKIVCHNDGDNQNNALSNLRYDTQRNNLLDRWNHGTQQIGNNASRSILTEDEVKEIKILLKDVHANQRRIADKFNVSYSTINAIKSGKNWSQVCIDQ